MELVLADKFASLMPDRISAELGELSVHQTLENVARCQELLGSLNLLEVDGFDVIAYKGPTLASLAHGSPTLRSFVDLDLWVPPGQYRSAARRLQDEGYRFLAETVPRCHLVQAFETTLIHPQGRVSIDLHRSFLPPAMPLNDESLLRETQEVEILGRGVKTLSNESLLILLLAHGSKHAWRELRWLHDIFSLTDRQEIDWVETYELALENRCHLSCQVGLHLVQSLFGADQSCDLFRAGPKARMLAHRSLQFLQGSSPGIRDFQSYHWNLCPTLRSRMRYLFHTLVAPHELDLAFVDLPEELYWLYYFLRPIRKAGSLLRR